MRTKQCVTIGSALALALALGSKAFLHAGEAEDSAVEAIQKLGAAKSPAT